MKTKNKMINGLICLLVSFGGAVGCAGANNSHDASSTAAETKNGLPELHNIQSYTFEAPYSCNGSYEKSALFVSKYSKGRNSPELLFNGACGSTMYIESVTAGDDMALIADLGEVPLEFVSASKAFNYKRVVGHDNTFKQTMPAIAGHTYAVLIAKDEIRALLVLTIDEVKQNGKMTIRYAVKSYQIKSTAEESKGFRWEKGNS